MSEPVVIIGPASRPAEPAEGPPETSAAAADNDAGMATASAQSKTAVVVRSLAGAAKSALFLGARAARVIGRGGKYFARRYPRHSLAAGASVAILGAIWYTEIWPRMGTRGPVATQIKIDSSSAPGENPEIAAHSKTDKTGADPSPATSADIPDKGETKPVDTANPQSDAALIAAGSAPVPNDGENPALPPLASRQPEVKPTEPAPAKDAAPTDPAAAGKHDPAPGPAAAATLLAGALPDPAPAPAPVAREDKASGDALKPAPAVEAPPPVAMLPSPNVPGDPAPAPAPTRDSVELATKLEPAGDPIKLTPGAEPSPADTNPKETPAPATTKTGPEPPGGGPLDSARAPGPSISAPESTKTELIRSEPPQSEPPKVQEPAAVPGPASKPEMPVVPPAALELAPPGGDAVGAAKPKVDGSPSPLEASPARAMSALSHAATNSPVPVAAAAVVGTAAAAAVAATDNSKASEATDGARDARNPAARQDASPSKPPAKEDSASEGWVSVPNSGKVPIEGVEDAGAGTTSAGMAGAALASSSRDVGAHAAKDASFELESPRTRGTPDLEPDRTRAAAGTAGTAGTATAVEARSSSTAGRVEAVPHVVERGENFWSISRLYYSSGRYYRALWKANADTHPDIRKLRVNDVIVVPPVEDLDPAYIDAPKSRVPAEQSGASRPSGSLEHGKSRDDFAGSADAPLSSSVTVGAEPFSNRTNQAAREGVPVRRSSRTDPDLDLPPPDAVSRRTPASDRPGRRAGRPLDDADEIVEEPASRTAARAGGGAARRPVYKIRPFDTPRSIARDMLGDSHRASEILDLNRDLIDDPSHLIVGQVIELPEDARTSVRRSSR